ncbi:glycosyl transferase family 2 [Thalassoporum mexicanum PCC 7367]|uniref:glycosyltransferase n=1 Tax=Thalassoporum mexicanum TaxID=3457544 RepID=UPI00029FDCEE|nr:glycosyltransferase [Pseudanabaena sp. PCC 7367]AFY71823.1 glycosyl transferase family 2 [Pseudanabaena sp. PCC 7367]
MKYLNKAQQILAEHGVGTLLIKTRNKIYCTVKDWLLAIAVVKSITRFTNKYSEKIYITLKRDGVAGVVIKAKNKIYRFLAQRLPFLPDERYLSLSPLQRPQPITIKTSPNPQVSLLIYAHNNAKYAYNCLKSINQQIGDRWAIEVILIDDASTDYTKDFLKKVSGINVVRNKTKLGHINAYNQIAKLAKGDFLCFLDQDYQLTETWLESLLLVINKEHQSSDYKSDQYSNQSVDQNVTNIARNNHKSLSKLGHVGAVGSRLIYESNTCELAGGIVWQEGYLWRYGHRDYAEEPEYCYLRQVDFVAIPGMLIRRDDFNQVGGFSDRYSHELYAAADFGFKLRSQGWQVVYQPEAKLICRHEPELKINFAHANIINSNNSKDGYDRIATQVSSIASSDVLTKDLNRIISNDLNLVSDAALNQIILDHANQIINYNGNSGHDSNDLDADLIIDANARNNPEIQLDQSTGYGQTNLNIAKDTQQLISKSKGELVNDSIDLVNSKARLDSTSDSTSDSKLDLTIDLTKEAAINPNHNGLNNGKAMLHLKNTNAINPQSRHKDKDIAKHQIRSLNSDRLELLKTWRSALPQHYSYQPSNFELAPRRVLPKPTVLIIDTLVPAYDKDSGSYRLFNIIKILQSFDYHIIFLPDYGHDQDPYTGELESMGIEVLYFTYKQNDWQQRLERRLPAIDLAWVCRPELCEKYMPILRQQPQIKVIYDTIDLHFVRMKRQWELGGSSDRHLEAEWQKMQTQEVEFARRADLTLVVTEVEKELLDNFEAKQVRVVPNVHEIYPDRGKGFADRQGLLFIGGYYHEPNVDAVIWLCAEIMPLVWRSQPDLHLTLLGSNPSPAVKALASDRVSVPGYIKDVEPYFTSQRLFIAPLRYGAGMKGKIGHSLSYGLPTITTSIGAEGIGLVSGENAIVVDEPEQFATEILNLYNNEGLWQKISQNSFKAMYKYTPEAVRETINQAIAPLLVNSNPNPEPNSKPGSELNS